MTGDFLVDTRDPALRRDDPTYVQAEINANPVWRLAFRLSEFHNDQAPIGWSRYIGLATALRRDVFEPLEKVHDEMEAWCNTSEINAVELVCDAIDVLKRVLGKANKEA